MDVSGDPVSAFLLEVQRNIEWVVLSLSLAVGQVGVLLLWWRKGRESKVRLKISEVLTNRNNRLLGKLESQSLLSQKVDILGETVKALSKEKESLVKRENSLLDRLLVKETLGKSVEPQVAAAVLKGTLDRMRGEALQRGRPLELPEDEPGSPRLKDAEPMTAPNNMGDPIFVKIPEGESLIPKE